MPITQKEKKYLKNKHKGGKNNSKGAIYESYYATYQIVSFMNQYITQLSNVHLTTQLHDAFVDDLFIEEPNAHKTYHQLKDVKDLTWETSKLKYDFKRQTEISSERNEKFKLKFIQILIVQYLLFLLKLVRTQHQNIFLLVLVSTN